MNEIPWDRVKEIFTAALAVSQQDRPALLDRLCEGDANLRREVESLFDARTLSMVRTGGAAQALADMETASIADPHAADRVGTTIHRYKLLQLIGEGGFGTVYMAEQTEPVRRKVALKVIKPGMDSRAIIARFEAERQALAMMDHPHIARILDGGVTPLTDSGGGLPYFVMEYVIGDPITKFADAHRLSIADRLGVFQQVCSAVQHAHTKGIIHRDLKPANVIVSMVDDKPFAKVIDFGIAKATGAAGGSLTAKTLFTEHRQLIGTPEYMSPEQAEGSLDIDTRTDVYALGVLLYELLTGSTPIESERLRSAAYDEMRRMIREDEPPSPSLRLSRSLDRLARTAAARKAEPARLSAMVKGELDWIVMKALEKERARRYETASALADDVKRHLVGEAVVAAPVSRAYRVRKFVRKNKGAVGAVSAVVLALAAGGSVAAWQWTEASDRERQLQANANVVREKLEHLERVRRMHARPSMTNMMASGLMYGGSATLDDKGNVVLEDAPGQPGSGLAAGVDKLAVQAGISIIELSIMTDAAEWSAYTANLALARQALDAKDYPELRRILARVSKDKAGWEYQFLRLEADRVVGLGPSIDAVWTTPRFSADGSMVVAASTEKTGDRSIVHIWNSRTGEEIWRSAPLTIQPLAATLAPGDADIVLEVPDDQGGGVAVLDRQSGAIRASFAQPAVVAAAWFPPSSGLVPLPWGFGSTLIWDVNARTPGSLTHQSGSESPASVLQPSGPPGSRLVICPRPGVIEVVDASTGRLVRSFDRDAQSIAHIAIGSGGSLLAVLTRPDSARERSAEVLSIETGAVISRFRVPWKADEIHFSEEHGALIVTGDFGEHSVHDVRTTDERHDLLGTIRPLSPGAVSPDGSGVTYLLHDPSTRKMFPVVENLRAVGGPEYMIWMTEVDRVVAALTAGAQPISGLSVTTPDGSRRLSIEGPTGQSAVRFYETKDGKPTLPATPDHPDGVFREVAVFRMPEAVTNLQMTGDGTRLIISLESGSALVWDIRDPEERRKDLQAEWAERVPAGAYLDTLWASDTPDDHLRDVVINDASLTPLRRLVAAEMLEERLEDDRIAAEDAFEKMKQGAANDAANAALDPASITSAVRAAAAAVDLPNRVKARVVALAAGWEYRAPEPSEAERLAAETAARQMAEAQLTLRTADMTYPSPARDEALQAAYTILRDRLGSDDPSTVQVLNMIANSSVDLDSRLGAIAKLDSRFAAVIEPAGLRTPEHLSEAHLLAEQLVSVAQFERAAEVFNLMGRALPHLFQEHGHHALRWTFRYTPNLEGTGADAYQRLADSLRQVKPDELRARALDVATKNLYGYAGLPLAPEDPEWRRSNIMILVQDLENFAATDANAAAAAALGHLRLGRLTVGLARSQAGFRLRTSGPTPLDLVTLSLGRAAIAKSDPDTLAAAAEIDGKPDSLTGGKVLDREGHRAAAREALAKARALMAPATDGTPSPWANDEVAKALLAEAEALIEGQAATPGAPSE